MRYDVTIHMEQKHTFAIEADSAYEAQTKALLEMGNRDPELAQTKIDVEKGVK